MIDPDRWTPTVGISLEPNALAAVRELSSNVVLTAGPGAGKTELLAQRADYLLRTGLCRYPSRILAISFKLDAKQNLRDRVNERCPPRLAARLDSQTFHGFAKGIIDRFRVCLTGLDALDADYSVGPSRIRGKQIRFEDMVPLALEILTTSGAARNAVRQTFSHVFLDEFQDCTESQYDLVREAFGGSTAVLTAVGDTKQRIMAWAGALEGITETFAEDFDAKRLNLYQNFRSAPRLRRMQNAMIKVMDPNAASPDEDLGGDDGIAEMQSYSDDELEAEDLAKRIDDWIKAEGVWPADIAVLIIRQPELYGIKLMEALEQRGIPVRNEKRLQDLFTQPVVRLFFDVLNVIFRDRQPMSYERALTDLCRHYQDDETGNEARSRWQRFFDEQRRRLRSEDACSAEEMVACLSEVRKHLDSDAIVGLSPEYEDSDYLDQIVEEALEHLTGLWTTSQTPSEALERFGDDGAVRVMTIHKSKGLEFDSVVVLGVENQTFWGELDQERSAFFVAVSRAKRRVLLTRADHREKPPGVRRWKSNRTRHSEFATYIADLD